MKQKASIKTPVTRNLKSLFEEPLPQEEPVIVHMTENEWKKLSKGIQISKKKISKDAKGVFVTPDPFGGFLGFFACAAGSGEGEACVPEIVRSGGTITFGRGCSCVRGKDPVDKPINEQESCSLGISIRGFRCTGTCIGGRKCHLVRVGSGQRMFITCECS